MPYDLKIIGLANKDELKAQGPKDHLLYKFTLSEAPDGFWVLLLQQAGRSLPDVTVSGNAGNTELWASADASVSVKIVLDEAKRAVAQANADARASDEMFNKAAREKAASAAALQGTLAKEIDELDFSDPAPAPLAPSTHSGDLADFDAQLKASEKVSKTAATPADTMPPGADKEPPGGSSDA